MQHQFTLSDVELRRLLTTAAELGARRALIGAGMEAPMISYREACKKFGRSYMELWSKQGKLSPVSYGMGAIKRYYVQDLLALSLVEERHKYLTIEERRVSPFSGRE